MTDNQREAGTIILDPTHVSFSQQEGVNDLGSPISSASEERA